jgi:hypothetical protein
MSRQTRKPAPSTRKPRPDPDTRTPSGTRLPY